MLYLYRYLTSIVLALSVGTSFLLEAKERKPEKLRPHYNQHKIQALKATTDYFNSLFWTQYAPIKWKSLYFGWNPDTKAQKIKAQFDGLSALEIDQIKPLFNQYIESTRDGHVGLYYDDQRLALIPLDATLFEGKVIITNSDLPGIQAGDELIAINDKPTLDYFSQACYASDWDQDPVWRPQFNFERLFFRSGKFDALPSSDQPTLQLQIKRDNLLLVAEATWEFYSGIEDYMNQHYGDKSTASKNSNASIEPLQVTLSEHSSHRYQEFKQAKRWALAKKALLTSKKNKEVDGDDFYNDSTNEANLEEFDAMLQEMIEQMNLSHTPWSIREVGHHKIGYFALPDFQNESLVDQLDQAMESLIEDSEALIIDLRNNGGGYDFMCFAILSRLIDRPLLNTVESYMLSESQVCEARQTLEFYQSVLDHTTTDEELQKLLGEQSYLGYSLTRHFIKEIVLFNESLIKEWESGFTCTRFMPSSGVSYIMPYQGKRYTKPLFVLINECCGSNGDAFPAILKDNGRAQLIGRTTAGLGGCIESYTLPNFMGIQSISLTRSLMLRNNQLVIEDLGVTPDVEYKRTLETILEPDLELEDVFNYVAKKL